MAFFIGGSQLGLLGILVIWRENPVWGQFDGRIVWTETRRRTKSFDFAFVAEGRKPGLLKIRY